MINIENITKTYGSMTIIREWKYRFEDGRIYGLIGRNGIGKTTLMKTVCGLILSDAATIETNEGDVSTKDYLKRDMYYVSDEPIFYNDLTLKEHLWLVCRAEGYSKDEAAKRISFLVDRYKMQEYMNYFPTAMSKGTIQRMMLIMALLRKTTNLLLDEPFNGLDPIQLKQSLELIKDVNSEKCIVISSHDIESLEEICDVFLIFTKKGIVELTDNIDRVKVNEMIGDSYD